MTYFLLPAIAAGLVSAVATGLVVRWGARLGIVDDPNKHKHAKVVHDRPVPRGGGLPIFAALLTIFIFTGWDKRVLGIVAGAAILTLVGWLDDRFEEKVSPYARLLMNILAAVIAIGSGIGIAYISSPLGGVVDLSWPRWCWEGHCLWVWSNLFALIWLVAMQNIVGWSSGVDGQMPGFVIIAAVTIMVLGARFNADFNQWPVITLAAVTAGAYAGFLPWNWYPQKIMPGYGGKSLAGFLLGVLAIFSGAKVGAMAMVLGIPLVDAAVVIIKRLGEGRSPVWGGYEHLHHVLLSRGWGKRKIALFYWAISLVLAMAALQLNSSGKYFTMATVVLVVGGVIVWLHYFSEFSKQPGRGSGSKT